MAGTPRDANPGPEADPFRRRKAIEELEHRFRERPGAARPAAAGPVAAGAAGELDVRVADEMRQFFTESAERAAKVVPTLEDSGSGNLRETTGEIRRKIDDFFSSVQEPTPTAAPRARPASPASPAAPTGQRKFDGSAKTIGRSVGSPDAVAAWSQAVRSPSAVPAQRGSGPPQAPAPAATPSAAAAPAEPDRPKMDLKTALERLRRHGVVRGEVRPAEAPSPAAAGAGPAAGLPAPAVARAPVAAAPSPPAAAVPEIASRPAAPPAPPPPPPARSVAPPAPPAAPPAAEAGPLTMALESAFRPPRREPTVRGLPALRQEESPGAVVSTSAVPVLPPRRDGPRSGPANLRRDATATSEVHVPTLAPEPSGPISDEVQRTTTNAGPKDHESHELEKLIASSLPIPATPPGGRRTGLGTLSPPLPPTSPPAPPPPAAGIPDSRPRRVDVPKRVVRRGGVLPVGVDSLTSGEVDVAAERSAPTGPRSGADPAPSRTARGPGAKAASDFDAIFDEIQGLVQQTLEASLEETMNSARTSTPEMEEAVRIGTGEIAAQAAAAAADDPPVVVRAASGKPQRPARPVPPAPAPVSAPASVLPTPVDDEEDESAEEQAPAPDAPYDWGVRKAAKPRGAWLLGEEEQGLASLKRPAAPSATPSASADAAPSPARDAAPAAAAAASAGAGGGRGYLVRKLSDEVRKLQPAVASLEARGVVSRADLADGPAAAPRAKDDDMLSVDQFAEHKPVDLEAELSPAKLVEELRRVRRLMDALKSKGLLSDADMQPPDEE